MAELLIAIIVALLAGAAAFAVMGGGNQVWWKDLIFGFIGGILGSWLFSLLGLGSTTLGVGGVVGTMIAMFIPAFVGALIAIWVLRQVFKANV